MTTLDYESIEIYLGERLRRADCLDIHTDHFFPVTLLDMLFHYSEKAAGTGVDSDGRPVHRNFHGHDFDRWIDNLVARTLLDGTDARGNAVRTELIDIDSMTLGDGEGDAVDIAMPDGTAFRLLDAATGAPLATPEIDALDIAVDLAGLFDRPPVDADSERYMGFGLLAHILRVACERTGIDPARVDARLLSERIFAHFKDEMLPLIPSLWNDMEHLLHYTHPRIVKKTRQ